MVPLFRKRISDGVGLSAAFLDKRRPRGLSTRRGRSNLPSPCPRCFAFTVVGRETLTRNMGFCSLARFKSELAQRPCRPGAGSHDIFLEEWVTVIAGRFRFRLVRRQRAWLTVSFG